jgi:hypothetical protein
VSEARSFELSFSVIDYPEYSENGGGQERVGVEGEGSHGVSQNIAIAILVKLKR